MKPLYSTKQIREADDFAINKLNMPGIVLMENAAINIVNEVKAVAAEKALTKKAAILCGKGNNGGDGFACARHLLNDGYEVLVIYIGGEGELKGDALANYGILRKFSGALKVKKYSSLDDLKILEEYPVIMDALLGSGFSGGLKEPYKNIIEYVNGIKSLKIAVDIPTGLDADKGYAGTAFHADYTICLGALKKGLFFGKGKLYSGIVIKGDIGIDKSYFQSLTVDVFMLEGRDILSMLPQRKPDAHKYSAGKTLVIAGSNEYPGAAVLASKAAFTVGSGSVILSAPETIKKIVFSSLPEVVFEAYNKEHLTAKHLDELKKRIEWADSIAIGPGLGRQPETVEAVMGILKLSGNKKVIIDADALFAVSSVGYKNVDLKNKILTPHLGEFSKLIDIPAAEIDKDITAYGTGFAKETGCILVLKGAPTIVFTPDSKSYINPTGNAGMAKFGMGDSLTGIIASYAAQMQDGLKASLCGVYLHSLSADMLLKEYDINSISASLLIDNFSQAVRDIVSKSN